MQAALRQINLPGNSRLDYDHSLEKSSLTISFEARTREEMELVVEQLKAKGKGRRVRCYIWTFKQKDW